MNGCALLQAVCDHFELGRIIKTGELVGGRSHEVKRVTTERGDYVLKKLVCDQSASQCLDLFRNTAAIACAVQKNRLPAIAPLTINDDVLCLSHHCVYMAYPYIDTTLINRTKLDGKQCNLIARFVAQLHTMQITVPADPVWGFHYKSDIWKHAYAYFSSKHIFSITSLLERLDQTVRSCFVKYHDLRSTITADVIVSHRDIDPYNILWPTDNTYAVIDWDLAGQIDAAVELMYVAIGFARIDAQQFNFKKFTQMLATYSSIREIKTSDPRPLLYTVLANWLSWQQAQLQRMLMADMTLSTLNLMVGSLRESLLAMEYMLCIEPQLLQAWRDTM